MDITSRATAQTHGLTRYFTGKPYHKGHNDERYTINGKCVSCANAYDAEKKWAYYLNNSIGI